MNARALTLRFPCGLSWRSCSSSRPRLRLLVARRRATSTRLNVAFPDEAATYWVTRYTGVPGAEIVIRGRYPDARYFSFHIYDEALRPIDSVADFETTPDGAGGYTTGFTFEAPQSGALIYRVYVSGVPGDPAGGVPLPGHLAEGRRAARRSSRWASASRFRRPPAAPLNDADQGARTIRRRRRGATTSPA